MSEQKTHWLQSPNKNYLGHWDLPEGNDLVLTIKSAQWEEVTNPIINKTEAKRVVRFKEDVKPFICNQGNAQSIIKATGIKHMEDSVGSKISLFIGLHFDRVSKDHIDCIRIKPNAVVTNKPKLDPSHKNWDKAKEAVQTGTATVETIRKNWTITEANYRLLCG
tara:strand:- start:12582 stop:13073 length:492 start_codon:yes stop_codon:yes gene_type:complete